MPNQAKRRFLIELESKKPSIFGKVQSKLKLNLVEKFLNPSNDFQSSAKNLIFFFSRLAAYSVKWEKGALKYVRLIVSLVFAFAFSGHRKFIDFKALERDEKIASR